MSLPHSRNAGLSSLRLALGANERSTREMNAGSAFRDVLRREDGRNVRRIAIYMKNPRHNYG